MDQFQFFFRDHPAGPVRGTWQEAAQDAVAAGLADWVHENPHRAINWVIAGQGSIARMAPSTWLLAGLRIGSRSGNRTG